MLIGPARVFPGPSAEAQLVGEASWATVRLSCIAQCCTGFGCLEGDVLKLAPLILLLAFASVTNDEVEGKGFNPWQYPELPDGKAP